MLVCIDKTDTNQHNLSLSSPLTLILDAEFPYSPVTNQMWERGRARLQNYLKEIGWTETIIDVRSKCTRNLLKLGNAEQEENISPNVNGTETNNKRASESQGQSR